MINKKNAPLIISFAIPILMIAFITAIIYLPGIFLHPKYNFLYTIDSNYYAYQTYVITKDHLILNPEHDTRLTGYPNSELYLYDVSSNESKPISFQEANKLTINPTIESPDGYKVERGNQSGGFFPFFVYDNDYAQYIVGHNLSKKIHITSSSYTYYDSFHFLGWVLK